MSSHQFYGPRDTRRLERSPLVNVVWQVRFSSEVGLRDGRAALDFQRALGRDTDLTSVQATEPGGQGETGWRLTSDSEATNVTLSNDTLTLETVEYVSWDAKFSQWIADCVRALENVMRPGLTTRVGLRYINVIFGQVLGRESNFERVGEFAGLVSPALLGFAQVHPAADVGAVRTKQALAVNGTNVTLNSASVTAEDGEIGMLIDIDSYIERANAFEADELVAMSGRIHEVGLGVFQACITDSAWNALGPISEVTA